MLLGDIESSLLEAWLRRRYFDARVDISSSGVYPFSLAELRRIAGISTDELDGLSLCDSPSLGGDLLRSVIAARHAVPMNHVMVTHGSSEGIFLAVSSLLRPGDEVVVLRPVYQSLRSVAEAVGARVRVWELDERQGFLPDVDQLRALVGPRTKAVLVNFPHNPTGVTISADQLAELVALLAEHGTFLLWDAAFAELVHDGPPLPDPASSYDRAMSFGTLSKAYGAPGLRVGWCLAPPHILDDMVRMRDYVSLNTSPVTEYLAARLLARGDDVLDMKLVEIRKNRSAMLRWGRDHAEVFDLPVPLGGVTAFPRLRGVADATSMCEELFEDHGVLVIPGFCFGYPNRIRLGYGGPVDEFEQGLDRLTELARVRSGIAAAP